MKQNPALVDSTGFRNKNNLKLSMKIHREERMEGTSAILVWIVFACLLSSWVLPKTGTSLYSDGLESFPLF